MKTETPAYLKKQTHSSRRFRQMPLDNRPYTKDSEQPLPADENYDGYYDDVPTDDNGHYREPFDPKMVKMIALVAGGAVGIIILSVIVMCLL